MYKVHGWVGC